MSEQASSASLHTSEHQLSNASSTRVAKSSRDSSPSGSSSRSGQSGSSPALGSKLSRSDALSSSSDATVSSASPVPPYWKFSGRLSKLAWYSSPTDRTTSATSWSACLMSARKPSASALNCSVPPSQPSTSTVSPHEGADMSETASSIWAVLRLESCVGRG